MYKTMAWIFMTGLLAAGAAAAQSSCSDGTRHDDNSFEAGYGFSTTQSRGTYVMRIDPPTTPARLESACVCFLRDGTDDQITFSINVWAADGPGGTPGTLLGRLPSQVASGIPDNTATFFRYDLSSLGIVADGPVFIGPSWRPSVDQNFYVCADTNGPTSKPGYFSLSSDQDVSPASPINFSGYKTLGIRAKLTPVTTGACTADDTTLCLNNGRFEVRATFLTSTGLSGSGHVEKLTGDTGFFWFFTPSNVEVVVKVLNGCGRNNHYWFFAGGLTDVRTVLTVTDTQTGATKTYINPQKTAFKPVQDTGAFATCP